MTELVTFPGGKPPKSEPQPEEREPTILDMEDPLRMVEQLVGGILGLSCHAKHDPELDACYTLACKAEGVHANLKKIWETFLQG
jgi:hypothetical protein